jgi:hypothetical protein
VRIVHSSHRGSRDIEHIGSAHHDAELAVLKAAAPLRMAAGQLELDFGLDAEASGGPLAITSSRMARLWVALSRLPGAGVRTGRHARRADQQPSLVDGAVIKELTIAARKQ